MKFAVQKKKILILAFLALSVIPLISLITSLGIIKEREKVWYAGDYDPSYAYLYNSLNIATFRLVGHFDHPGTPMQITGSVILWGTWLLSTDHSNTLTEDVISNPEYYLRSLNISTAILTALILLLLSVLIWEKTRQFWIAFLFQLSPFISGMILYNGFTRTSQESMLLMASLMIAATCLLWFLIDENKGKKNLLMFGIISGFGLASKIIFAPLLIIPLIIYKPLADKMKFIKYAILSFFIFTIPIIPLYPRMGWWFIKLFIHSGIYGTGSVTVIEPTSYLQALGNLIVSEPVYSVFYLIVFIGTAALLLSKWITGKPWNKETILLAAILLTQTIGFLITAKHPKSSYLLPYEALSITAFIIILSFLFARIQSKISRGIAITIVIIPLSIFLITYGLDSRNKLFSTDTNQGYEKAWMKTVSEADAVIGINPGPSPIAAAYFANTYSWNHYGNLLSRLYPKYYIFDTYKSQLTTFDGKSVNIDVIKATHGNTIAIIGADVDQLRYLVKSDVKFEVINYIPEKVEVGLLQFK